MAPGDRIVSDGYRQNGSKFQHGAASVFSVLSGRFESGGRRHDSGRKFHSKSDAIVLSPLRTWNGFSGQCRLTARTVWSRPGLLNLRRHFPKCQRRRFNNPELQVGHQCWSAFTISSTIFLASARSIIVWSM